MLAEPNIVPTVVRVVITLAIPHGQSFCRTIKPINSNRNIDGDIINNTNAVSFACMYTDCQIKVVWCLGSWPQSWDPLLSHEDECVREKEV